jgi:hypothetical protein
MQPIQPLPRVYLRTSLADRLVRLGTPLLSLALDNVAYDLWLYGFVVHLKVPMKWLDPTI